MDDQDTLILSRLKDPWKLLLIDMDIAMLAMGVGFACLSMDLHIFLVVGVPMALAYGMQKLRQDKPQGFGFHWAYWHLPQLPAQLRRTPPSHCHRTLG